MPGVLRQGYCLSFDLRLLISTLVSLNLLTTISQQKDNLDTKTKAKGGYKLPNKIVACMGRLTYQVC